MLRLTTEQSLNRVGDTLLGLVIVYTLFLIVTGSSPSTAEVLALVVVGVTGALIAFNETIVLLYMQHRHHR